MMLEAANLSFGYGKEDILNNINFVARKGEVISLIGPNGSGKSTLLRCLSGLLPVTNGQVYLFDKLMHKCSSKEISQKIAFLPQSHERLNGITVRELVAMGRTPYHKSGWIFSKEDHNKINWAIDYMQIAHLKHRMVDMLSGGERQRVWISMVLAQDTPIILLDEPVTYMDLKYQWDLLKIIKDLKDNFQKTIVSVFHDINHALEIADYIYVLSKGRVHATGLSEQVITEQTIQEVYGICTHLCKVEKRRGSIVVPIG